jgi:hypothetical protein
MTARNAKSPDHLAMIGAFLYKCLRMTGPATRRSASRYSPWGDPQNDETPATGLGFLKRCLTMYPVGVPILSMGRPLARHAAAMRKTPTIS